MGNYLTLETGDDFLSHHQQNSIGGNGEKRGLPTIKVKEALKQFGCMDSGNATPLNSSNLDVTGDVLLLKRNPSNSSNSNSNSYYGNNNHSINSNNIINPRLYVTREVVSSDGVSYRELVEVDAATGKDIITSNNNSNNQQRRDSLRASSLSSTSSLYSMSTASVNMDKSTVVRNRVSYIPQAYRTNSLRATSITA